VTQEADYLILTDEQLKVWGSLNYGSAAKFNEVNIYQVGDG